MKKQVAIINVVSIYSNNSQFIDRKKPEESGQNLVKLIGDGWKIETATPLASAEAAGVQYVLTKEIA
jgi:hypothetical protein